MNEEFEAAGFQTGRPERLTHLDALLVSGPDARTFLQGQVSADIDALTGERVLLASCNSAQGRVQAVVWMIQRSEGLVLITTASMIDPLAARLRKYVLRSKVKIGSGELSLGVVQPDSETTAPAPSEREHIQHSGLSFIRLPGHRQLLRLAPSSFASAPDAPAHGASSTNLEPPGSDAIWRADDVAAGLPQIYPQTHEAFVAQMLNLDVLGGISFDKGCYTGQEIIARTHYRGAVKRRMFRFRAAAAPPAPGARVLAGDQRAGDVVDAVNTNGGCELLAVVSVDKLTASLRLDAPRSAELTRLPLPYEEAVGG